MACPDIANPSNGGSMVAGNPNKVLTAVSTRDPFWELLPVLEHGVEHVARAAKHMEIEEVPVVALPCSG